MRTDGNPEKTISEATGNERKMYIKRREREQTRIAEEGTEEERQEQPVHRKRVDNPPPPPLVLRKELCLIVIVWSCSAPRFVRREG